MTPRTSLHLAVAVLVLPAATIALGAVPHAAAGPSARPAAPVIAAVVAGETTTASGTLGPRSSRRPVRLERKTGSRWTAVARTRSATDGRYRLTLRLTAARASYRVVAPAHDGRRAVRTAVRSVRPLVQSVVVSVPSIIEENQGLTVGLRFSPARPGRPWELTTAGGTLAHGVQDASGRASAAIGSGLPGRLVLRATATSWRGAAAVSATRAVDVRPTARPTIDPRFRLAVHASDGSPLDADVEEVAVDRTGRYVAFTSAATNLGVAAGDPTQLFLADTETGTVTLVSHDVDGGPAAAPAYEPAISADGRFVVWASEADDLVLGDDNGASDVFRFDRTTGDVFLVSRQPGTSRPATAASGVPAISPDGRWIVFGTNAVELSQDHFSGKRQVVRYDTLTGTYRLVTTAVGKSHAASGTSTAPRVTDAGDVTVSSWATNLVAGDAVDGRPDHYVWRAATGAFTKISRHLGENGSTPLLSVDDGSALVFATAGRASADDLDDTSDVYLHRVADGAVVLLSTGPGTHRSPAISADGTVASWETELPDGRVTAVRLHLDTGEVGEAVLPPYGGTASSPVTSAGLSGDGRWVLYRTAADELVGAPALGHQQLVMVSRTDS